MTIFGWDASDFDWSRGPMDLNAARRDGIDFFTHKATEDTNVKHVRFAEAMERARAAGIPFLGAYHVVRSPANAAAEVEYFLAYVRTTVPWFLSFHGAFIQVDLEKWPYDAVPASEGEQFADIATARTGLRSLIYASKGQYQDSLTGTSHPLWNANYPNSTAGDYKSAYAWAGGDRGPGWAQYSGVMPSIWQYTSKATIGTQPTCDANAFRGTVQDFAAMIGGGNDMSADDTAMLHGLLSGLKTVTLADGKPYTVAPTGWAIDTAARLAALEAKTAAGPVNVDDIVAKVVAKLTPLLPTAQSIVDALIARAK